MTTDYGRPRNANNNRKLIEARLKEAIGGAGTGERLTIEWRGNPQNLHVIQVPVGVLAYNPATHRIRAQRAHDPAQDKLLEADPWSPEGQAYLHRLLKAKPDNPAIEDPAFGELSESLQTYGQSDPGLITHDGVLVNGNTRRAALAELDGFGLTHEMRVAVLPPSTTWADITLIELALQLRDDHRRDYTYINRLIAIDEQISQGTDLGVVAKTFRSTRTVIENDMWILNTFRELLERGGGDASPMGLMAFEDTKEKMRELHRAYLRELKSDPEQAELLKETRLSAVVLGFSKTDIRFIGPDFIDRYLAREDPGLIESLSANIEPAPDVEIPGLGLTVKGVSSQVSSARQLTDQVLRARSRELSAATADTLGQEAKEPGFGVLKKAVDRALKPAGRDARIQKRKQTAPNRLEGISGDLDQVRFDLTDARSKRTLDAEAFDEALLKVKASLEALAWEANKTFQQPGTGVGWLLKSFLKEI